jgi:hypothetical protein
MRNVTMRGRAATSLAVLSVIAVGVAVLDADQRRARVMREASTAPPAATAARISGSVITRDEPPRPVRRATVRARDGAGRIVGTTTTDDGGQFAFSLPRAGTYYVELVDDTGRVLAVEDVGEAAVSVTAGQNSTTILRVPGRLPTSAIGRTARTILGAASAAGIGTLTASGQPASPER